VAAYAGTVVENAEQMYIVPLTVRIDDPAAAIVKVEMPERVYGRSLVRPMLAGLDSL
jgi:hypothetical protein